MMDTGNEVEIEAMLQAVSDYAAQAFDVTADAPEDDLRPAWRTLRCGGEDLVGQEAEMRAWLTPRARLIAARLRREEEEGAPPRVLSQGTPVPKEFLCVPRAPGELCDAPAHRAGDTPTGARCAVELATTGEGVGPRPAPFTWHALESIATPRAAWEAAKAAGLAEYRPARMRGSIVREGKPEPEEEGGDESR
jgi:hypothetical protein